MMNVPREFQPKINTVYPPNNNCEFERWLFENYEGDVSDREYLPIFWTGYYVNNNYGKDQYALNQLQLFINKLDRSKKYFTVCQYDDSILNDVSQLDLYQFNMSKPYDYPLPLIGQPHPYVFQNEPKKYLANFIGNLTHPIREHAKTLIGKEGYYISFKRHEPEEYCRIIAQSHFTLCYRGYGLNSFRITEALQYGSIPVYISDQFIHAHNGYIGTYCVPVCQNQIDNIDYLIRESDGELRSILLSNGNDIYKDGFTYEGTKNKILNHLKNVV